MSKSVNIAIIGAGLVGSAFINQLKSISPSSINYNVVLIATGSKALISKEYSPLDLSAWDSSLKASTSAALAIPEILAFLSKSPLPTILVDNTSNADWAAAYPSFVKSGISIATPNKKAFSSDLDLWNQIFDASSAPNGGLVYHEASVGAGLPIINNLKEQIQTGDKVESIEGIFSGTLSYIFNEWSTIAPNDAKFSDVVKVAKELGYTEPDPRDDLNGLDVARKVTILARIAGLEVQSPTSFSVHSLIPKPLESVSSGAEYLERLPEFDDEMKKLKDEAASENKVLRFIGKVDVPTKTVSVEIGKYDFSHSFASLKGSDNVVSIKTARYQNPLVIQGAGAGAEVTAAGVLADVIKVAQRVGA
ncbi:unnamed protein product [Kuraishia capsulata CBS 1993]|uniref:Homoserine dehydrogenase n=1 Tax=Kuraishia capsulata CBS 1993 TaxID=1382522 RepID=W6MT25_9ASCO|nr:uncharacterized protein KUCA_T00005981001 [Kuraishia capsulata CBS 1993]CDK29986.1 unnamed protein product [Kuraishia capsulata CBS 1993]